MRHLACFSLSTILNYKIQCTVFGVVLFSFAYSALWRIFLHGYLFMTKTNNSFPRLHLCKLWKAVLSFCLCFEGQIYFADSVNQTCAAVSPSKPSLLYILCICYSSAFFLFCKYISWWNFHNWCFKTIALFSASHAEFEMQILSWEISAFSAVHSHQLPCVTK